MTSTIGRLRTFAIILVFAALYVIPVYMFLKEGPPRHAAHAGTRDVALQLKIGVAEFQKETVIFHIVPSAGKLLDEAGHLKQDLTLAIDPGTGPQTHTFKANVPLTPWTVSVAIDSGDILDYPFDRYELQFDVLAKSQDHIVTLLGDLQHVPHGIVATLEQEDSATGEAEMTISLKRSGSNLFVAGLSTLSLVLVAMGACAVAWHVAYRGRKIEFSMMTWTAALLFVIPAVRNALPGAPPTGALIDFLIFFWLQAIVVIATASLVLTWIRRGAS